jgi:hypothetical protein
MKTTMVKFSKILGFGFLGLLLVGCGAGSENKIEQLDVDPRISNPAVYGSSQDVVNSVITQNPCPQGAPRVAAFFHTTSVQNYGNAKNLTGGYSAGNNQQGSLTKVFIGQSFPYNDLVIIREFGGGTAASLYSIEFQWCAVAGIQSNSSFSNLSGTFTLDTNVGSTVGAIDGASIQIQYTANGFNAQLGFLPSQPFLFTVPNYNF